MDANSAMMVVGGAAGYKLMELFISYFFRKLTRDDYVTRKDCEHCQKTDDDSIRKLTSDIAIIKGILLVLAVEKEIPPDQLAKLTQ